MEENHVDGATQTNESSQVLDDSPKAPNPTCNSRLPPKPPKVRSESNKRQRSDIWDHFTLVKVEEGSEEKQPRAACNYCGTTYACDTKINGTSSMRTHINIQCKKLPWNKDKAQTTLGFKPVKDGDGESGVKVVPWSFNLENCRLALAEMIIIDELPFMFVENEGFKRFISVVQPKWIKLPSRYTVARDCLNVYEKEKKALKLALKDQRICLTTDTWTSIQNLNYMCLTAHYVDSDWTLQKRILNFCLVSNHKGETLGKAIESCLLEWGIDKFLTITVDNASSNNGAIQFLKRKTKKRKGIVLEHDFLHMRCGAHILNLIVCEGLKEMDASILKVRNTVRFVKSSPSRMAKFKVCAEKEGINTKSGVVLDVPTRWNSTYFMLERAIHYQKAFERLVEDDTYFDKFLEDEEIDDQDGGDNDNGNGKEKAGKKTLGPPNEFDWNKARLFVKFLKLFYNATLHFSGSLFVTSNNFFGEIMLIRNSIKKMANNSDVFLTIMAEGMREKFDKYWGKFEKINMLLFVAVTLDPRYKTKYVEWCYREASYDEEAVKEIVNKVREGGARLYNWYEAIEDSSNGVQNGVEDTEKCKYKYV